MRSCLLALLVCVAASVAIAATAGERPAFQDLRFDEDWSALAEPASLASRDAFDALKWIRLGERGALSLGGQARLRLEAWDGFAFGAPADDEDVLFLTRLRLHGDLHVGERFRVFVEAKAAFTSEPDAFGGARATDSDTIDLQNGFLEWRQPLAGDGELRFRAGRQELRLGKQRLVSPLDWGNARRTFDGVTLDVERGANALTLFAVAPVRVRPYERNDHVTDLGF
ncbi:MAG TPA: alginate export family protein, partial [Myxococcota bacterium]|nr:alginate export family protein [Myxococcota bacterium]